MVADAWLALDDARRCKFAPMLSAFDPTDCSVSPLCVNLEAQASAYEGLITALYQYDWFEGVYLWIWRTDPGAGGSSDDSYTPQGKPAAERVLRKLWG